MSLDKLESLLAETDFNARVPVTHDSPLYEYQLISDTRPFLSDDRFTAAAPAEPAIEAPPDNRSQFRRGFSAGVDQLQGLWGGLKALAGEAMGSESLRDEGIAQYQREMAEAESQGGNVRQFTEIDGFGDAVDWLLYTSGNVIPMLATSIAGGGVGGFVGQQAAKRLATGLVERGAARLTAQGVAEAEAKKQAAATVAKKLTMYGSMTGAGVAGIGMAGGEIAGSMQKELGRIDVDKVLVGATVSGLIDTLAIGMALKRVGVLGFAKEEIANRIGVETLKQVAAESGTEALQTLIERETINWADKNRAFGDGWTWQDMVNAGAAGAVGGAMMGGFTEMAASGRRADKKNGKGREDGENGAGEDPALNGLITPPDQDDPNAVARILERRAQTTPELPPGLDGFTVGGESIAGALLRESMEQRAQTTPESAPGLDGFTAGGESLADVLSRARADALQAGGDALDAAQAGAAAATTTRFTPIPDTALSTDPVLGNIAAQIIQQQGPAPGLPTPEVPQNVEPNIAAGDVNQGGATLPAPSGPAVQAGQGPVPGADQALRTAGPAYPAETMAGGRKALPAVSTAAEQQAPLTPAESAGRKKANKLPMLASRLGIAPGETITLAQDVGYATAGVPYEIDSITAKEVRLRNPVTGGQTQIELPVLAAQAKRTPWLIAKPKANTENNSGIVLQNRDRSTASSVAQMNDIANAPDYLRAWQSRTMDQGAPVVFGQPQASAIKGKTETVADGRGQRINTQYAIVEADDLLPSNRTDGAPNRAYADGETGKLRPVAGNGRAAGIAEAYRRGTADSYRQELIADAQALGIDPAAIQAMKKPVLVRLMDERDITPDIADRSNIPAGAQLSPVEQAANDARRINVSGLEFADDGTPTRETLLAFTRAMPETERGAMMNPDGSPTRQAVDRITAAAFAQAYGNDELVRLYAQATDTEARTIMAALAKAAGPMSRLSGAGEFDIRQAVAEAAAMAVNAARKGVKLSDELKNADLDTTPEAFIVAEFMAQNIRSAKRIADGLTAFANRAIEQMQIAQINAEQSGLFGDRPTLSRQQLFEELQGNEQNVEAGQQGRPKSDAGMAERPGADTRSESGSAADRPGSRREESGREGQATEIPELTLDSYTESDLARADAARKAADQEAKARDRADELRAAADAAVDDFTLTGSDRTADVAMARGQEDMFVSPTRGEKKAEQVESANPAQPAVSGNTIFTDEAAEKARALIRSKLGQLNSGVDPELLQAGIVLAGWHIEKGARTFAAFAKAMIDDMGDSVRPYLKQWYLATKFDPRSAGLDGLSTAQVVEAANLDDILGQQVKEAAQSEKQGKSLADHFYQRITEGSLPKDNRELRKLVSDFDGAEADNARLKEAQEDLEAAIARRAADIAGKNMSDAETFSQLLDLYNAQPNLNIRTSSSIENQAYSTPAPLAYLAARLAGVDRSTSVYEPTAGNGMLLLTADPQKATANELQDHRFANLTARGFNTIQGDALEVLASGALPAKTQDAVITNPPFGSVKDDNGKPIKVSVDGYKIGQIDHLIVSESLKAMKDDGKAVLIIGANKVQGGISTDDRIFFNWLYANYNVTSHFEVDGALYARQGASWPVRVISINGRAKTSRVSPVSGTIQRYSTWESVYEQYNEALGAQERGAEPVSSAGSAVQRPAGNDAGTTSKAADGQGSQAVQGGRGGKSAAGNGNVAGTPAGTVRDQPAGDANGTAAATDGERHNDGGTQSNQLGGRNQQQTAEQPASEQSAAGANTGKPTGSPVTVGENSFQNAYVPRSSRKDEGVLVPVNMADPLQNALSVLEDQVGDIDQFAMRELGYQGIEALHDALMGLQVDSVASAIYQIKENGKGIIIADQTGIGKGRQAAAMIRWAARNGYTPVFVTVKPQLFTDMYGDLADIGTHDIEPFIMNSDAYIASPSGDKLFANKASTHKRNLSSIAATGKLPDERNALFMTYSQINTENNQRAALSALAPNAIVILDESHNASGDSKTGEYMTGVLAQAKGVVYLSATYAKRPDNMPLYFKTDIGQAISDSSSLLEAMAAGGLPLQTVIANNLVKAGQMFRRERSYDGVSISTIVDTENREAHEALSDSVTEALRAIVDADRMFHNVTVSSMQEDAEAAGEAVFDNAGNQASKSVDHTQFSSVVHNFVRQMLLGLKANAAADRAIEALKRGEKPIIALENTMGSFLSEYAANNELKQGDSLGDFTYRTVLSRALDRTRYVIRQDGTGTKVREEVPLSALSPSVRAIYDNAQDVIDRLDISIPVSPLDWIRQRIADAGYSVAEITGRSITVDYSKGEPTLSALSASEQQDKVGTTRKFNSGELDAIILNVAGSTGISLHASEKFKDKRKRLMIVAQPAQDINIFMQMLGRVHRTGQVIVPGYELLNVDLPTEKRPTALLNGKMKSLNANTSSNTESATSIKSADMLNKYGDQVIASYLLDNEDLMLALDVGSKIDTNGKPVDGFARTVTGRMALMPIQVQKDFYAEVEDQYSTLMDYLNATNQNDLEPRTFDFEAVLKKDEVLVAATDPRTPFGEEAVYGEWQIKAQGKQMTAEEIRAEMANNLGGKSASEHAADLSADALKAYWEAYNEQVKAGRVDGGKTVDVAEAAARGPDATGNAVVEAGHDFLRQHAIGTMWRVEINGDVYSATITNLRNSHKKSGNPFSLSKIQVTLAVNGPMRSLTVPASQWKAVEIAPIYGVSIENAYRDKVDGSDKAKIITGNLLAAYGEIKNTTGTIISFTKQDGTTEQGILLPKRFDFKANTRGDYQFRSAADALKFLNTSTDPNLARFGIASRAGDVRVIPRNGRIAIAVPKSKARGGRYFLDKRLIAITGDFVSGSDGMVAIVNNAKAQEALSYLMAKAPLYALPSMAEDARALLDGLKAGGNSDPTNPDIRFSLNDDTATTGARKLPPLPLLRVKATVARLSRRWKGAPPITVVPSAADLPKDLLEKVDAAGARDDVRGIYYDDGQVFVIADKMRSRAEIEATLLHEVVGHLGLRALTGERLDATLDKIFSRFSGTDQFRDLAWRYYGASFNPLNPAHRREIAEELVAHIAETGEHRSLLSRVIYMINRALQTIGFRTRISDRAELLELIRQSEAAVSRDSALMGDGNVRMSRTQAQTQTDAFKRWFGDSQVVDADGNSGTFDPTNPDIRFSRTPQNAQAYAEALKRLGLTRQESAGVIATVRQTIDRAWQAVRSGDLATRAEEGIFDGLLGLKRAEEAAAGGKIGESLAHADSGYVAARLATLVADVVSAVLQFGSIAWQDGVIQGKPGTRGLLDVLSDLGPDLQAWLGWMGANRAKELAAQGRENNLTPADIDALLSGAQGKEALFERVRQEYIAMNRDMLDLAQGAGLIDAASRAKWESEWYVPFYRQEDDADGDAVALLAPRTKRGLSHQASGIKALRGGEFPTANLLTNIITNWTKLIDASMKNKAMLKAVDNLKDSPEYLVNESFKYTQAIVPRSEIAKQIRQDRDALIAAAEMLGVQIGVPDAAAAIDVIDELMKPEHEGFEKLWAITAPKDPDIVRVQRNGKNEYYRVKDAALLRALTHMGTTGSTDPLTKAGRYMKRLLTTAVTASPDFILRNWIRDTAHAWAINPDGFRFGTDSIAGLKQAFSEDQDYKALMFGGGAFQGGYVHATDPDASAQLIERELKRRGMNADQRAAYLRSMVTTPKGAWNALQRGWERYRGYGDKVENANRLATFKRAIEAGKPVAQAIFEAKDLMDYSLRGNMQAMMWLTDVIPFLNARLQGLYKLGRAAGDPDTRKKVVSAGIKIAIFSVILAALNDDDEKYRSLPDWDKDANWHVFINGYHFRIPKPFEIGIVFGTAPERIYRTMITGSQETEKLAWSLKHAITGTLVINPIPQALKPIAEVYANRSFFFETPIEGMADEGKLPEARYDERTSDTMRLLGEWTGTSPKKLEHLYNGYLGTIGMYALSMSDALLRTVTGAPDKPERDLESWPAVRAVYAGTGPARSTQYQTDMYDRLREVDQLARTIKAYRDQGLYEKAKALLDDPENRQKLATRRALGSARKRIGEITKRMDAIARHPTMSPEEKRKRIEVLTRTRTAIAQRVISATESAF